MSDLRRQLAAARTERDKLRAEVAALRLIIGDIPPEYAIAFAALCELAYHGLRRPDDLGGPVSTGHASSRPPAYHPAAYHLRNEERRELRRRGDRLMHRLENLVDNGPSVVAAVKVAETA